MADQALVDYALRLGDSTLILAQRVSAWCGHAPALEEDIAMANVALDLLGLARHWLALAGEIEAQGRSADDLAFLRDVGAFRNVLLVERPNGDFAATLMRQYLFDAWHLPLLSELERSADARVAGIAAKGRKEAAYHLHRSRDLVIRLGDGTDESRGRMQRSLDALWPYTGELVTGDAVDEAMLAASIGADLARVGDAWNGEVEATLGEATLVRPAARFMHEGGKRGVHTEALGYVLAEMQFLQRAYPGAAW